MKPNEYKDEGNKNIQLDVNAQENQAQQRAYFDSIVQDAKEDDFVAVTEGAGFGFESLCRTVTACKNRKK